ncbi:MAG TPA: sugar phosphate isomerase/epimerase [Gemmataceae bacterium]|nr:sugar phosphate isomerase/epimerase [Gemmataceae bacterium]
MIVACSTLCFGKYPFERALQTIAELGFSKVDVAIHEEGPHLKPSEVAADVHTVATRLRLGPGLTPCAFSFTTDAPNAPADGEFAAVCRLARLTSVPIVTIAAASAAIGLDAEARRLKELCAVAARDGVILTVATLAGTLTETPDGAVELCHRVPGLGLTLDPSHYVAGPHPGVSWDALYPYVRHVHLRDTGCGPNQFQVRIGQGEIEYGKIVSMLARHRYDRVLTVDVRDIPDAPFAMEPEVRKLKYLLESLV